MHLSSPVFSSPRDDEPCLRPYSTVNTVSLRRKTIIGLNVSIIRNTYLLLLKKKIILLFLHSRLQNQAQAQRRASWCRAASLDSSGHGE